MGEGIWQWFGIWYGRGGGVDEVEIANDDDLEREFEIIRGVTGGEFTPDMNIGNFLMHFLSMEGEDEDLIDENDESLDAVDSSQLEPQDDPDLGVLKTFIFRVDVMSQFNVFDDSMDISIKQLIVL